MEPLFASGRIVDLILALVALEAAALWAWGRGAQRRGADGAPPPSSRGRAAEPGMTSPGKAPSFPDLLPNLLAGACLLLALRASLAGAAWPWIAAPLALSLVAHLADLRRRGLGLPLPRSGAR